MTTCRGRSVLAASLVLLAAAFLALPARAEIAVGENVNMVTGRKMPGGDPYLQRQNEPSIAVGSLSAGHLLAGANDYRTVDIPFPDAPDKAAGDAWAGVFKSLDGGRTWQSVLLPGYPQDTSPEGAASPIRICRTDPPPAGSATPVPVKCVAAADPVVRAGTDGLFYYAGIAFTRDGLSSKVFVARFLDGNDKENGDVTEASDPIRYRDTAVVATGGPLPASPICPSGAATHPYVFVDKPWIAVDVPRGLGSCALTGKPAGAVYAVYTAFRVSRDCTTGADTELSSDVMFSASYDCGASWSTPSRINTANSRMNQGAAVAIEPISGRVYVVWRRVASSGQADAIVATRSHGRKKQFANPRVVATIVPFDQGGTETRIRTQTMPSLAISSDGASSWAHVAWSQRAAAQADGRIVVSTAAIYPPPPGDQDDDEAEELEQETRLRWSTPAAADAAGVADDAGGRFSRGHQFMPALTFGQGRLVLTWYDSRLDHTRGRYTPSLSPDGARFELTPGGSWYLEERKEVGGRAPGSPASGGFFDPGTATSPGFDVFDDWTAWRNVANDPAVQEVRRTVDVRVALAPPGAAPVFRSAQVTSYGMGYMNFRFWQEELPPSAFLQQLAGNPPNLTMFRNATRAFFGDYIDVQGPAFVPDGDTWRWNSAWNGAPVFHAIWTSNQNVRPPADGDWTKYTPVKLPGQERSYYDPDAPVQTFCSGAGGDEGSRNQDIYTSRISEGLVVSSPQNAKPLALGVPHGFVVAAQNTTAHPKRFRFSLAGVPAGVSVSFSLDVARAAVEVEIPARSSATRSAFAMLGTAAASPTASFAVVVTEVGGCGGAGEPACLSGAVTINPPGSISSLVPPDGCSGTCDIAGGEVWSSKITNAVLVDAYQQPTVLGPTVQNPTVQNPTVQNPTVQNPTVQNPTVQNPTVQNPTVQNAVVMNPSALNPTVQNPTVQNPTVQNPTVQNPTVQNPTVQNAPVSDLSWDVTNDGNTATSYHVQVVQTGSAAVPPLQLIVTRYYLTPYAYGCKLYEIANGLTEVNVPDVSGALAAGSDPADPAVPESSIANVTISLAPGETKTVTLRGIGVSLEEMAALGAHLALAAVPHGGLEGSPTYGDVVVIGQPTATALSWDAASGEFTASVTPPDATGAVTFVLDGAAAAVVPLDAGAARFRYTPDAGQRMVAYYAGDATHQASVSDAYVHGGISTRTTLTSNPTTWAAGSPVVLQAQVTADLVTDLTALLVAGRVQPLVEFVVDGVVTTATFEPRSDVLLATYTTTFGPGDHAVSARFVGFGTGADRFLPSDSNTLSQTIGAATPIRVRSYYVSGERQWIGVEQGGVSVTDALVEVNGTTLPYLPAPEGYWGNVAVPPGSTVTARIVARGQTVTATATVPYVPTLLSPAAASTFAIAAGRNASPVTLTWDIVESPTAEFIAWATWTAPSGEAVGTPFASTGGTQREISIPAGQIQSGTALLHLEAVNAGAVSGDASADSYFQVASGQADVGVTSGPPQVLASVYDGVLATAWVLRGDGADMNGRIGTCDALVQATDAAGTSLGVATCDGALGTFTFTPPVLVPPGGRVTVAATFQPSFTPGWMEPTAYVSGTNPFTPTILAPGVGEALAAGTRISAAWAAAADPSLFEYEFRWNDAGGVWTGRGGTLPGTARVDGTIEVPAEASAALGSWGVEFRLKGIGYADAVSAGCSVECGVFLRGGEAAVPVVVP